MNWNDSSNCASTALADELSRFVDSALALQIVTKLLRIHVVRAFVDVDELRKSSRLGYCLRGGNECVRNGHDHLAWLYSRTHQGKSQSIGSAIHRHSMLGSAELGECLFEILHHRTTDESSCPESPMEDSSQFLFKFDVGSNKIKEWNSTRNAHFTSRV